LTARAKIILSSLSLVVAAAGMAAQPAAAAAPITAGTVVKDTNGGQVGTVASVDGEFLIVKTDKHEVKLPKASFTATDSGLLFGMTQAQLNAEVEKAKVDPAELLKAGAVVRDTAGGVVGTVETVEADLATVKLPTTSVQLPVSAFAADAQGLVIGVTAAELEAQVSAAAESTATE
jgi:preprotein translocase subunit YajC